MMKYGENKPQDLFINVLIKRLAFFFAFVLIAFQAINIY
jgi:hypothetical protein